jgi:tRNA threonylcarbamoyladenosine biosynthesis protein TsaE
VTSPTYTLINEYPGRLTLFHVDLYRLAGGEDLDELGLEEILYGDGVVAIEWPDRLAEGELPADHLAVRIEIPEQEDDDENGPRRIDIQSEGEMTDAMIGALEAASKKIRR